MHNTHDALDRMVQQITGVLSTLNAVWIGLCNVTGETDVYVFQPKLASSMGLQEADESPFGEAHPDLLRGLTSTDVEASFLAAFRAVDPDNKGLVSRQVSCLLASNAQANLLLAVSFITL